jgi:hypothetical protein
MKKSDAPVYRAAGGLLQYECVQQEPPATYSGLRGSEPSADRILRNGGNSPLSRSSRVSAVSTATMPACATVTCSDPGCCAVYPVQVMHGLSEPLIVQAHTLLQLHRRDRCLRFLCQEQRVQNAEPVLPTRKHLVGELREVRSAHGRSSRPWFLRFHSVQNGAVKTGCVVIRNHHGRLRSLGMVVRPPCLVPPR